MVIYLGKLQKDTGYGSAKSTHLYSGDWNDPISYILMGISADNKLHGRIERKMEEKMGDNVA